MKLHTKTAAFALTVCMLAGSLSAGSAFAKSGGDNGWGHGLFDKSFGFMQERKGVEDRQDQGRREEAKGAKENAASVTSDTYGGKPGRHDNPNRFRGLFQGQGQRAGAALVDLLLTQYEAKLTAELKARLEAIQDKAEALSAAADVLEQSGSVTDAVYAQQEAVKVNFKNLHGYVKLGKLLEKIGDHGVKLYVNGERPAAEVAPFIREGSTLVPFRAISEALKANVSWNAGERSVTVTRGGVTVKLLIDAKTAYVDGRPVNLEVPAAIENGSTVVPARFISEALKADVQWDGDTQSVVITENEPQP